MKNAKLWFFLGLLLSLFALSNLVLWGYFSARPLPFEETKALYLRYFPEWARNGRSLAGFFTLVNVLSLYLVGKTIAYLDKTYRRIGIPVMMLNTLMLALQLWSLM